jgi:regulatory protein
MRALSTRERTVAELRACLENKRVDPADIDAAVEELAAAGLLDDARYARRFAEDKRELQRWGSERIERDLRKRGIAPELIETVLGSTERSTELESAVTLLRERFGPPRDDRERDRAWRLLVRRGYEAELAYEAVRELSRSALA